jgi:hypothetical protein
MSHEPIATNAVSAFFGILIAGLAEALIRSGDDLTLECGTVIEIILDRPIEV